MPPQTLLSHVQARLASGREPYHTLHGRLRKIIAECPKDEAEDYENATFNANLAKARAFLYWAGRDLTQARRAAHFLATMRTDIPKGYLRQITNGVRDILDMSETLTAYAQAFHFLSLAEYPHLEHAQANLTKLAGETAKLVKAILNFGHPFSKVLGVVTRHNYLLKGSSAVGLAGLYLNRPEWVALGQKGVEAVCEAQGPNLERGWGEGANYFAYAAVNFLPFFIALNRQMNTFGENFHGVTLQNYLADPIWKAVFLWYLKTRLPSGVRPGVDDARYTPFFSGLLATAPALPEHATDHFEIPAAYWSWDWYHADLSLIQAEPWFTKDTVDLTADMIINFDDRIPRLEPTGEGFEPTQISRVCGQAVFRSGWNRDAIYFLLQGEEKKMVHAGGRHEHNDGTSFILCAYGELLALDSGYPDWSRRAQTNQPQHHNRILIAGHEPEPTARLEHFFELPHLEGVQSGTWFSAKNGKRPRHERNVLFVNKRFFVLDDLVRDAGGNEIVSYIHGHGGGSLRAESAAQLHEHGAAWQRPNAALQVYQTTSVGAPRFSLGQSGHGIFYLKPEEAVPQHEVLQAKQHGDTLRFLTLLYPQRSGAPEAIQVDALAHGLQLAETTEVGASVYTVLLTRTAVTSFEQVQTPWGTLQSKANFILISGETKPRIIYCDGAREIKIAERVYLKAQTPFHGALEWDEVNAAIHGRQISAATSQCLEFFTNTEPVSWVGIKALAFDKDAGSLRVELDPLTREFGIHLSAHPFHRMNLTPTTGIHPWQPYGDGEDYLRDETGMLLQRGAATKRFLGYQRHGLTIMPGTRYRLHCLVKTELQSGFVAAGLGEWSGEPETHHDFGLVSGAHDWQEISGEWSAPRESKTIAVVLYGSENFQGRAWFKDPVLEVCGS